MKLLAEGPPLDAISFRNSDRAWASAGYNPQDLGRGKDSRLSWYLSACDPVQACTVVDAYTVALRTGIVTYQYHHTAVSDEGIQR